jgi:hypothetical protein
VSILTRASFIILQVFSVVLLAGGAANASPTDTDSAPASQRSTPCDLPVQSPPPQGANSAENCRSTQPTVNIYFTNINDTSGCTFDVTITWNDGKTTNIPTYAGGPQGLAFLASHTYSATGIYTIAVTGSVVSGDCTLTPYDAQFSYISSAAPYPEGPPISVQTMLSRAANWISVPVPYSQSTWYSDINGTYRQDCSGFVSMAWDLDYSLGTSKLSTVATDVASGLKGVKPGDIILSPGIHVYLFVRWLDSAHTTATVDYETGVKSKTPYAVTKPLPVSAFKGFKVYRYNEISSSS